MRLYSFTVDFADSSRVNVREVSFGAIDCFSLEAVREYEKEYYRAQEQSNTGKAILLCSPHNALGQSRPKDAQTPKADRMLGRCYGEEVLKAYMRLCGKLGLHLILK
jgi:hypothetical protein